MHQKTIDQSAPPVRMNWVFLILSPALVLLLFWMMSATASVAHAQSCPAFPNPQARFGYNVARENGRTIDDYAVGPLNGHWYLDYFTQDSPSNPAGMRYAQMLRPGLWRSSAMTATVEAVIANNPNALWIVGNEPDRDKQDGMTPTAYATFYHDAYHFLKARSPESRVAIAGVVQSTPLRRRYLDMVLAAYQTQYGTALPVDIWTMHAFILAENKIWGASIPPGLENFANEGMQYSVWDHDNLEIFQTNILAFRQWMADNGYRDKALIVTEYGILLPDIAFPYAAVRDFMVGSFDYLLSATDAAVGYPADNNHLVQSWSWFSLNYPPYDPDTQQGLNGNLLEPTSGLLLELGRDYGNYIAALQPTNQLALAVTDWAVEPTVLMLTDEALGGTIPPAPVTTIISGTEPAAITVQGTLRNQGTVDGCNLHLQLWLRDPAGTPMLVEHQTVATVPQGTAQPFSLTWQPAALQIGNYELFLAVSADNGDIGLAAATADRHHTILVLDDSSAHFGFLPLLQSGASLGQ